MKRLLFASVFLLVAIPAVALAQPIAGEALEVVGGIRGDTGVPDTTVEGTIGTVVQVLLSLSGLFFLILMVYAGLRWMMARGEDEVIKKARGTVVAAVIGLVITISGYAISVFITRGLFEGVDSGDSGTVGTVTTELGSEPIGCCILRVTDDTSMGAVGPDGFDQVGQGTWIYYMDRQTVCDGHVAAPGTVIVDGPEWYDIQDANECRQLRR